MLEEMKRGKAMAYAWDVVLLSAVFLPCFDDRTLTSLLLLSRTPIILSINVCVVIITCPLMYNELIIARLLQSHVFHDVICLPIFVCMGDLSDQRENGVGG